MISFHPVMADTGSPRGRRTKNDVNRNARLKNML